MLTKQQLKKEVERLEKEIQRFVKETGAKGVVIGNSGGKDSALVIGLCARALGAEHVMTIAMPCESKKKEEVLAKLVADTFGVAFRTIDLTKTYLTWKQKLEIELGMTLSQEGCINAKPRLRMTTLRSIGQTMNYLLMGTGNRCEIYVGYFTKDGDNAYDYNAIAEFYVSEVYQMCRYIGIPEAILQEQPSDGVSGISDEEKLQVTYQQIEAVEKGNKVEDCAEERIKHLHKVTAHKRGIRPVYHRLY